MARQPVYVSSVILTVEVAGRVAGYIRCGIFFDCVLGTDRDAQWLARYKTVESALHYILSEDFELQEEGKK